MYTDYGNLVAFGGLPDVYRADYISAAGLEPIMSGFGGANRTEQLVRGMNAALTSLKKYTSTFSFDERAADDLFDLVESWQNANGKLLSQYIASGADTVPEQVALSMGADRAQQYIIASFATAAKGIKGWAGGAVVDAIRSEKTFSVQQAEVDSESRLMTFATIVKLDRDGGLDQIFRGKVPTSGLGFAFLAAIPAGGWWLLTAVAVATISAFAILNYSNSQNEYSNKLIDKLCEKEPERCKAVLERMIEAQVEKQGETPFSTAAGTVAGLVAIGVVAVIGVKYVLPSLLDLADRKAGA